MHEGNAVTVLQDGGLFPAMQADIQAARHTVHLETFVWTKGNLERQFVELLCAKAREGVKVRLLVDAIGGAGGDGAVGYVFGHGIADQWLGHAEDKDHWRDTAVRVEGRSCAPCRPYSGKQTDSPFVRDAFHADLRRSTELSLDRWRKRPWRARAWSWLAYKLHDQL